MENTKKKRKSLTLIQTLCITGVVILAVLCAWTLWGAIDISKGKEIARTGEIRIATYTSTHASGGGTIGVSRHSYFAEYYYIDINGIEYTGLSPYSYKTREEAEKLIGSEVEIKIDGKGNSVRVDQKINTPIGFIVVSSVCFAIILGLIFLIILEELKRRKRVLTYRELFKRGKKTT